MFDFFSFNLEIELRRNGQNVIHSFFFTEKINGHTRVSNK